MIKKVPADNTSLSSRYFFMPASGKVRTPRIWKALQSPPKAERAHRQERRRESDRGRLCISFKPVVISRKDNKNREGV